MKLSKSLLLIPAASSVLFAALVSGACGTSLTISVPVGEESIPADITYPPGIVEGASCTDGDYIAAGSGWLLCDGTWSEYTTTDPSGTSGWSEFSDTDTAGGSDSGNPDDAGGSGSDSSTAGDDAGGSSSADDGGASSGDVDAGGDSTSSSSAADDAG